MAWTDESGTMHPSMGDEVTPAGLEHIDHCDRCKPQTADPATSATPGSDCRDVPEGTEYTPEQAARRFLSMSWDQQVASMVHFREAAGVADACRMLNHEGAHIFATQHTCHDRYQEGFEDGKQAVVRHMERLADEQFGPKEENRGQERWTPGDTGLTKEIKPGTHIYVGAEESERLGLRVGLDGWSVFEVFDGEKKIIIESSDDGQ